MDFDCDGSESFIKKNQRILRYLFTTEVVQ